MKRAGAVRCPGAAKACRFLVSSQSLSGLSPRSHTLIISGLRIGPVPVGARRAVLDVEDQQDDPPNERHERDENPPARAINIVKPPDRYGDARDQNRQTEDAAQQTCPRRTVVSAEKAINNAEHDTDDYDEQNEVPVLLAPGASAKDSVLFQRLDKPTQSLCPLSSSVGW